MELESGGLGRGGKGFDGEHTKPVYALRVAMEALPSRSRFENIGRSLIASQCLGRINFALELQPQAH